MNERDRADEILRFADPLFVGEFAFGLDPDDEFEYTDETLLRTLGYPDSEGSILAGAWRRHLHPLNLNQIEAHFYPRAGDTPKGVFLHPVRYRRCDGRVIEVVLLATLQSRGDRRVVVGRNYRTIPASAGTTPREDLVVKAFDLVPLGLLLVDSEGHILRANPEAHRIWGEIPPGGPENYHLFRAQRYPSGEPIEPEDWPVLKTLREGTPVLDEALEIETRKGERRVIINTTTPLIDSRGSVTGAIVMNRDITEHRQILGALDRITAFRRALAVAIPDILIIFDGEGNYLDILAEDQSSLPAPREDILGRNVTDVLPAQVAQEALHLMARSLESGEPKRMEYPLVTESGERFFEAQIVPPGQSNEIVTAVRDITDRKRAEKNLREREEELSAIYDNAPLMIVVLDEKRRIVKANAFARRITGLSEEAILGRRVGAALHCLHSPESDDGDNPSTVCGHCGVRSIILDTLHTGRSHHQVETTVVTSGGNEGGKHHLLLSTNRILVGDEPRVMVSIMDVTQRREYERRLEYLSRYDTLTGLHNRASYEENLRRLDSSKEDSIGVICLDLDGLKLINDTMGHELGDHVLITTAHLIASATRAEDFSARVGGDEFVILLPNTGEDATERVARRIKDAIEAYNREGPSLPLSISVGTANRRDPYRSLAEVAVEAEDRMYHNKLQQSASARSHIIEALLATLAEKDYITGGHARRLNELTHQIGIEMGLNPQQLSNLSLLSRVHDLGKVSTPDRILNKREPLTPEEWDVMRQHPEVGYRIASSSRDLAHIADLILKHHEHWDGNGYPLGNDGEEIPIECRILAVADAYDAMTNDRPYRSAISHEEALEELKRNAGTQFDPRVVEVFARW